MENWQRDWIRDNHASLIRNTNCQTMMKSMCMSGGVLTAEEIQRLDARRTLEGKNAASELFYEIVSEKEGAYDVLLSVFEHPDVRLSGARGILQEGKEKQLKGPVNRPRQAPTLNMTATDAFPLQGSSQGTGSTQHGSLVDEVDFTRNITPLTVDVVAPKDPMAFEDDYNLPVRNKGYCLVINVIDFDDPEQKDRDGGKNDTYYMTELWTQLGYTIFPRKAKREQGRWTAEDIRKQVDDFKQACLNDDPKSIVVFIGSHGAYNEVLSSDHEILLLYPEFINKISTHEKLKPKPKIFLVNTCQGIRLQRDEIQEPPIDHTVVVQAQVPGFVANRDIFLGSWFAYCLTDVFMRNAHKEHLHNLLFQVQNQLRKVNSTGSMGFGQISPITIVGLTTLYFKLDSE